MDQNYYEFTHLQTDIPSSLSDVEKVFGLKVYGPECPGEQGYLGEHGRTQPEAGSWCRREDAQVQLQLPEGESVLLRRSLNVQVEQVQLQVKV